MKTRTALLCIVLAVMASTMFASHVPTCPRRRSPQRTRLASAKQPSGEVRRRKRSTQPRLASAEQSSGEIRAAALS